MNIMYRYKIYMEGIAWSVSEKYILACDSMSLLPRSRYYDFFTRSLEPTIHYWPITNKDLCSSVKFAVDWGNKHPQKVNLIYDYIINFLYSPYFLKTKFYLPLRLTDRVIKGWDE